ncbi:hypothetical protein BCR42DRAFT_448910 [Absidia repens]|uniref:Uncharacterized protein n=1 Tax=Absidia repens TaxID=90262 RepID=A0A1X2IQS4_9FUNG|nr:hypothetical protein BCR42DRAFT_448910 [Absidia repens]
MEQLSPTSTKVELLSPTSTKVELLSSMSMEKILLPLSSSSKLASSLSSSSAETIPTASSLTSIISSSFLPSPSLSVAPLVTPSVDQLLRIFNNTDTPPDHFLKGIREHLHWPLRKCYRRRRQGASLSMYWIPKEGEWDETEDGKRVLLQNNDGAVSVTPLLDPMDHPVANVSQDLWHKCRMEGTCLLKNGDLINLAQGYTDRFVVIGKKHRRQNIFGWGAGLQNLRPYVSVAANDIPLGTTLYVRELHGLELGNGQIHNGCVSVDDDGWSFGGCQLDFFVVSYVDHLWLDRELDLDHISVTPRKCDVLNYSTMDHLKYMNADPHLETLSLVMNDTMVWPNDTLSTWLLA